MAVHTEQASYTRNAQSVCVCVIGRTVTVVTGRIGRTVTVVTGRTTSL